MTIWTYEMKSAAMKDAATVCKQAERIAELEDCIRAMIETAYAPVDTRQGVVERAQRTLGK